MCGKGINTLGSVLNYNCGGQEGLVFCLVTWFETPPHGEGGIRGLAR